MGLPFLDFRESTSVNLALQGSVNGTLYWGGISGQLLLVNIGDAALNGGSYSFLSRQKDIQVWSSAYDIVDLVDGSYEVTIRPPIWGAFIPSGGSQSLSFNAVSFDLPNSGTLTDEMFFVESAVGGSGSDPVPEPELQTDPNPQPESDSQPES